METVTFDVAPREVRLRAAVVLAVSLGLQVLAFVAVPWFTLRFANGESMSVRFPDAHDADLSTRSSLLHVIASIVLLIGGLGTIVRLGYFGATVVHGSPFVKRGLLRSKLIVAWKHSLGAHIQIAFMIVVAIYVAVAVPQTGIPGATLSMSWGGAVLVLGLVVAHASIWLVAGDARLADSQCWDSPSEPVVPAPVRASRPMIKSPLPPPPAVNADPFRSPPRSNLLEDRLVRPALPTQTPAVVPTENVDEPSLLR
jgi:hypothetical protein